MSARKTFLLVENDPNDVLYVKLEFERAPLDTDLCVVRDGVEAVHYLEGQSEYANRQKYPLPDVILLDLRLPRVNGFQFLEWLRLSPHSHRLIPVVALTSSALHADDVSRAYALGANSHLVKPVNWHDFRERIQTLGISWPTHVASPKNP